MSTEYCDDLLRYNIKLMRTIGLWPLETKSTVLLFFNMVYTVWLVVSLAVVSLGQVIQIFVSPDISSMASAVDLATLTASALFKMIYIIWHHKEFQNLLSKINSTFVQTDFFAGTLHMSEWARYSEHFINIYVVMGPVVFIPTFGITPYLSTHFSSLGSPTSQIFPTENLHHKPDPLIFSPSVDIVDIRNNTSDNTSLVQFPSTEKFHSISSIGLGNHTEISSSNEIDIKSSSEANKRKFPFNCWFPFDATWSPLYEIVYLLELFPLLGSGHIYLVSDSFFFMIIYLSCGQLELLKISLKGLQEKYTALIHEQSVARDRTLAMPTGSMSPVLRHSYSRERAAERELNEAMLKYIDFHSNILDIIRQLDLMLRAMILVDFIHAIISLSFAMLQTIISNGLIEWIQMAAFIALCILHQFLNNFFGEILIQQQTSVAEAVYDTPWVEGSGVFKTAVYMTTAQAQRPIRLSGWKMYHLGFSTFVEFMKLLVSYFLVLQSLHADESTELKTVSNFATH